MSIYIHIKIVVFDRILHISHTLFYNYFYINLYAANVFKHFFSVGMSSFDSQTLDIYFAYLIAQFQAKSDLIVDANNLEAKLLHNVQPILLPVC